LLPELGIFRSSKFQLYQAAILLGLLSPICSKRQPVTKLGLQKNRKHRERARGKLNPDPRSLIRTLLGFSHPGLTLTTVVVIWAGWALSLRSQLGFYLAGGHPWSTADWAINYDYGFTRRGLFGTLLVRLDEQVPLSLLDLATLSIVAIYTLVVATTTFFLLASSRSLGACLATISPLAIGFGAIAPGGSGRKELLIFLWFFLVLLVDRWVRQRSVAWPRVALLQGGFLFLVLTHEGVLFWLPLVFALSSFVLSGAKNLWVWLNGAFLAVQAALVMLMLQIYRFPQAAETLLCESLLEQGFSPNTCSDSAVTWLAGTLQDPLTLAAQRLVETDYLLSTAVVTAGVLLPLVLWAQATRFRFFINLQFAALPVILAITDWGRGLHIAFTLVVILLLADSARTVRRRQREAPQLSKLDVLMLSGPVLSFALGWGVSEYGTLTTGLLLEALELTLHTLSPFFP
jgi:hypothetical protein